MDANCRKRLDRLSNLFIDALIHWAFPCYTPAVSTQYTADNSQYRRPPSYEESVQLSFCAFGPSSPANSVVPDVVGSDAASTSSSALLDDIMECIQLDKAPHASPRTPGTSVPPSVCSCLPRPVSLSLSLSASLCLCLSLSLAVAYVCLSPCPLSPSILMYCKEMRQKWCFN